MKNPEKSIVMGRVQSPFDIRDYHLKDFMPKLYSYDAGANLWSYGTEVFDQGATPHCAGFTAALFGNTAPIMQQWNNDHGHEFYAKAKLVDGLPKSVEGTTMKAIAKVLLAEDIIHGYAWARTIDEVVYWILNRGPMMVGTAWTEGMFQPDESGNVKPTGKSLGGHAYELYGINAVEELLWGVTSWGEFMRPFSISMKHFEMLLHAGGEAIAAVEVGTHTGRW